MAPPIFEQNLSSVALSDENYAESLAFFRFWFVVGHTYHGIPSEKIFDAIWNIRRANSINPGGGKLIHPTAHLVLRFASDVESDHILAPHSSGLQSHFSTRSLQELFTNNLMFVANRVDVMADFYSDANLVAHWANLGYVEEAAIRNHILQSLISHPKLYDHQADALIILFKLAGATFEAYADPSVVDRCFKLLQGHKYHNPYEGRDWYGNKQLNIDNHNLIKKKPVQVRAPEK